MLGYFWSRYVSLNPHWVVLINLLKFRPAVEASGEATCSKLEMFSKK